MAMREYIGARYVPRFTGLYDVTQQYEALDVVDNGSGTSYIARKPVPANTPLTDTEYWFVYGASSGAIISLQGRMDNAENDISNIQLDINALSGSVLGLKNRMDSAENNISNIQLDLSLLSGSVLTNKNNITALTSRMDTAEGNITKLTQLVNRRFVLIGDSYAEGIGATTNDGWTQQFKNSLGLSNNSCYISYLGGSGFVGNVADRFIDLMNNLYNTVSHPETITDVVVCGGHNDAGKVDVDLAVNAFCARATVLFPNATITIGMCAYNTQAAGTIRKALPATMASYYGGIKNRVKIINELEFALRKSANFMSSDGIHPSALGYRAISKAIISGVLGGSGYQYAQYDPIAVTFTDITNHSKTVYQYMFKDYATLRIDTDLAFITLGSSKPTANTWFKIGTFDTNGIFHGAATQLSDLDQFGTSGMCLVQNHGFANGSYRQCKCMLGIYQNQLYIKLDGIDPSTGVFIDMAGLVAIALEGIWQFETLHV